MRPNLTIVPATAFHAEQLAPRLRTRERILAAAIQERGALPVMLDSLNSSACAWTVMLEDQPALMFGIIEPMVLGNMALIWLLTTDVIERQRVLFLRRSRELAHGALFPAYPNLHSYVDASFEASIRWLKWVGFTVHAPTAAYPGGPMIHRVEKRAQDE